MMLKLSEIGENAKRCNRCQLRKNATQVVFGEGKKDAKIMIIGDTPSKDDDLSCQPFSGETGNLLNKILEVSYINKEEVYFTNVVKCHPQRDRTPENAEVLACKPWLDLEIASVRPDYIICLGLLASRTILNVNDSLNDLREKWHQFGEIKVLCTYHPKTLLRDPKQKVPTWEDFKMIIRELGGSEDI